MLTLRAIISSIGPDELRALPPDRSLQARQLRVVLQGKQVRGQVTDGRDLATRRN
jgi:hypothetical protein